MEHPPLVLSMDAWLVDVRDFVQRQAPDIAQVLDAYAGEALYGRSYISYDLAALRPGPLELGAGALLLSCQLAREGFQVTALEPVGRGFSHFDRLHLLVLEFAQSRGHAPAMLRLPAEELAIARQVDFAFSINVMEHVQDFPRVIECVLRSLKPGASYRFTCPNYLFPYEPHFNLFTLFSKSLTMRVRASRIINHPEVADAKEVWNSLNWISVPAVARAVRAVPRAVVVFNRQLLTRTVERMATDPQFAARHTGALRLVLLAILRLRLQTMFAWVPASLQPVMDCVIATRAPVLGAT